MNNCNCKNFKIDFIGIGAPRCATTWIWQCLKTHPQICCASRKEIYFFDNYSNYKKGLEFYCSFFRHCSETQIKGEYSTTYFENENAPALIKKHFPYVKLIVCLRNPIERAYSYYLYDKSNRAVTETFENALLKYQKYIKGGLYFTHLQHYLRFFPLDNILILIYEDIEKNPVGFMRRIYKFLQVDENFVSPYVHTIINAEDKKGYKFSFLTLYNIKKFTSLMKKNIIGRKFIELLKIFKLQKLVNYMIRKNMKSPLERRKPARFPPMDYKVRKYLQEIYQHEIYQLEKLIGRDLSFWK